MNEHIDSGGPYLQAALICEKILVEQDGVKSAIRIIDRLTRTVAAPDAPDEMVPFEKDLQLLIRLKSGRARGRKTLSILVVKPSGESPGAQTHPVMFGGEDDRGSDVLVNLLINFDQVGVYWFEISVDGSRLTRVPFRIVYMPQVITRRPS